MKLLIDADFICYKACAAAEEDLNFGDDVIVVVAPVPNDAVSSKCSCKCEDW